MRVRTDNESMINELFIRLNRGKALSGAEIRSAMSGVIPLFIKEISSTVFFQQKIRFNVQRKQDENTAAKLLLIEFRGSFVDTKKRMLDLFVEEAITSESENFESAKERVIANLLLMEQQFSDRDMLLRSASLIPIFYWFFRNHHSNQVNYHDFIQWFVNTNNVMKKSNYSYEAFVAREKVESFYNFNLSIKNANDRDSLQQCYFILESLYDYWYQVVNDFI